MEISKKKKITFLVILNNFKNFLKLIKLNHLLKQVFANYLFMEVSKLFFNQILESFYHF